MLFDIITKMFKYFTVSFVSRLFSCGTSKDGDSFLVEWNESEGAIKRTYTGFRKKSSTGVVQFDTMQNHFLAAGEDSQIKYWDMDNVSILTSTDADGGLPVCILIIVFCALRNIIFSKYDPYIVSLNSPEFSPLKVQ